MNDSENVWLPSLVNGGQLENAQFAFSWFAAEKSFPDYYKE